MLRAYYVAYEGQPVGKWDVLGNGKKMTEGAAIKAARDYLPFDGTAKFECRLANMDGEDVHAVVRLDSAPVSDENEDGEDQQAPALRPYQP